MVSDREASVALAFKAQLPFLKNAPIMIAQHWEQHHIAQLGLWWVPFDIEVGSITAGLAILQDVPPPGIFSPANRHMIRNNVENLFEPVRFERSTQERMAVGAAELLVDLVRVH